MKIAIIGTGNMGSAIALGLSRQERGRPEVHLLNRHVEKARALAEGRDFSVHAAAGEWLGGMEMVVLAVKPQFLEQCCAQLRPFLQARTLVLSVAAGVCTGTLARWLGHEAIVRAMPNTPALVSKGITGLYAQPSVGSEARAAAQAVMDAVGTTFWVGREEDLHTVTGGSGSGPAYVFLFMEALSEALVRRGLPAELAREEALRTFEGAAELARQSGEPFALLREKVTSKGGTTAKALEAFERGGFKGLVDKAVEACVARSREMERDYR